MSTITTAVRGFFAPRLARLRHNWLAILQGGVAAGGAYFVAQKVFGHPEPFFAPMAALIVLGLVGGERIRRSWELVVGVSLGVGLGDLFVSFFGTGSWQMPVMVLLALALGQFVDRSPLAANQAAFAAVLIATIMPPGTVGGFERMFDATVGGIVGLIVVGLLPRSPLAAGRMEVSKVLNIASQVLSEVAESLTTNDAARVEAALRKARGSQGMINNMIAAAAEGKEYTRLSPLLWRQRARLASLVRILNPVDNAMRNTRVLARRAQVLIIDQDSVSERQLEVLAELADIAQELSVLYRGTQPVQATVAVATVVKRLRYLGAELGLDVSEGRVLSAQVVLAQSRSIVVDLLQVCGMSRSSAAATLQPTSQHPGLPPEVWDAR